MFLVNYQTMVRRYGAQRHPRLDDYDALKDSEELVEWRYVPIDATTIYVCVTLASPFRRHFHQVILILSV